MKNDNKTPGLQNGHLIEADAVTKLFPLKSGISDNFFKQYFTAVNKVSLKIFPAEAFGLIGESGSGKSSLGRMLTGLLKPSYGRIFFDGKDLARLSGKKLRQTRRKMQTIFQNPISSLDPGMRIKDTLAEAVRAYNSKIKKRDLNVNLAALLDMVGLPIGTLEKYPNEFSAGERQRIAIARALAVKPRFIVADEPVSSLDRASQAQIISLLSGLKNKLGITLLVIAHDLNLIRHLCDFIGVMYMGYLIEWAKVEDIFSKPGHPYTQALIKATLSTNPDEKEDIYILPGDPPSPSLPPKGCIFHTRCEYADAHCKNIEPPMLEISPKHSVKCHYNL